MIPVLESSPSIPGDVADYLAILARSGFRGDIETDYGTRLVMSTDNSIYQCLPAALLYPFDHDDVSLLCQLAAEAPGKTVHFSARGGGTGTNGQSLTAGIVVDLSRHMNRVLEVNPNEGWVRVEAGMVKDALNEVVREHGLFFAPDTSTSNRATIGGMINTDASGQGSLVYGKTSDHVLSLRAVLASGEELRGQPVSWVKARALAEAPGQEGAIYRQLIDSAETHPTEIRGRFPALNRFLTGYDLKHAATPQAVDLSRLLCGSEGSLAIVTEARLNLEPIPSARVLVSISYHSFDAALRHAPVMVAARATSVETVDSRVIQLARGDVIWGDVVDLIADDPERPLSGLNLVEFSGSSPDAVQTRVDQLCRRLDEAIGAHSDGLCSYRVVDAAAGIERLYAMRKKAVGLLGRAPGRAMPTAFVEDACVPPERLADFIAEFRALLDAHGLEYGMFGHVDSGVLHVRPLMDLCDPGQRDLIREISDQVVALTARYGGLLWGEHGRGYRAEYGPAYFGDVLFAELRRIKAAFDPLNRMNPGKICTPWGVGETEARLSRVDDPRRGEQDEQIPESLRDLFAGPADCNGNGLCFNYANSSPMCPSFKVTADRRYSPKGRAALLREWLRQLSGLGCSVDRFSVKRSDSWLNNLALKPRSANPDDYSHQVLDAMNECLACKACTRSCPVSVDIPRYRALFLTAYHTRYRRPLRDYLLVWLEELLPWLGPVAPVTNAVLRLPATGWMLKQLGLGNIPPVKTRQLERFLAAESVPLYQTGIFDGLSPEERASTVLLLQDPFNRHFEPRVLIDTLKLLDALGRRPVVLPYRATGKPAHVIGFQQRFEHSARRQAALLSEASAAGVAVIGLEPSIVLCFRDEYRLIGLNPKVHLLQEWLLEQIVDGEPFEDSGRRFQLFVHCSEKSENPATGGQWQRVFSHFGASVREQPSGCCGMAGVFGHQAEHRSVSERLYAMSWEQPVREAGDPLVTGYSCRSQVRLQSPGVEPRHPVSALLELVSRTTA